MFRSVARFHLKTVCFFTFFLFPLFFIFVHAPLVRADETERVEQAVFLPFNINISGDYGHLENGLTTILANRVAGRAGIRVVHDNQAVQKIADWLKSSQEEKAFAEIGRIGVEHLVIGELSGDKDGLLATVQVISKNRTPSLRVFSRRASSMDGLLLVMEELAGAVAADISGNLPVSQPSGHLTDDGLAAFQTAHPVRAYKKGLYGGVSFGMESGGFTMTTSNRSARLTFGANDMDAADLDGDGREEIVLAGGNTIHIYHFQDGNFRHADTIELDPQLRIHALSTGDLDNNGIREIYASANDGKRPASAVIEWAGKESRILVSRIPWYLRVIYSQGKPLLLGQVAGRLGSSEVIGSRVYQLALQGNKYSKSSEFPLPDGLTVFDIALADLDGSGEEKIVAIGRNNNLIVYDRAGQVIWADPGQFGASSNYLGTISELASGEIEKFFVPTRIVVRDISGDGIDDIVVGMNRMSFVRFTKKHRYFEGSSIVALGWQDDRLVPLWETHKLPDYLIDSQLLVSDNDGTDASLKLFFALGDNNHFFGFWQDRGVRLVFNEMSPQVR